MGGEGKGGGGRSRGREKKLMSRGSTPTVASEITQSYRATQVMAR